MKQKQLKQGKFYVFSLALIVMSDKRTHTTGLIYSAPQVLLDQSIFKGALHVTFVKFGIGHNFLTDSLKYIIRLHF